MLKKAEQSSVFAHAAVCVRALRMCVRALASVRGKLLIQRGTVPLTNPSILYARLVPSGSPYIES